MIIKNVNSDLISIEVMAMLITTLIKENAEQRRKERIRW